MAGREGRLGGAGENAHVVGGRAGDGAEIGVGDGDVAGLGFLSRRRAALVSSSTPPFEAQ